MASRSELVLKKIKPAHKKKKKTAELRRRRIQLWHLLNQCPQDPIDQILEWIDDLGDSIAYVLNRLEGEQYERELEECKYYFLPPRLGKGCTVVIETSENEKPNGAVEIFRYSPAAGPVPGPGSDPLITHGGDGETRIPIFGPAKIAFHLKNRRTCKINVRIIRPD